MYIQIDRYVYMYIYTYNNEDDDNINKSKMDAHGYFGAEIATAI